MDSPAGISSDAIAAELIPEAPVEATLATRPRAPEELALIQETSDPLATRHRSTQQPWRTKKLTVQPSQRFQHHSGTGIVPLGVLEANYPNRFNLYHVHLQGYILGGILVAKTQFFLYLGLELLDGAQFVASSRRFIRVGAR